MYFLISIGFIDETLFYFVLHGLLKSLLFLMVGFFIINNSHHQDIRQWRLCKGDFNFISFLPLFFFSLGGLNLSLSFDIKHSLFNIYGDSISFLLVLFFFLVYSFNSILYGIKFFFLKSLDKKVLKSNKFNYLNNKVFIITAFILITIIALIFLFYHSVNLFFNFPNTTTPSLLSIGVFSTPLIFFFIFKNSNLFFFYTFFLLCFLNNILVFILCLTRFSPIFQTVLYVSENSLFLYLKLIFIF